MRKTILIVVMSFALAGAALALPTGPGGTFYWGGAAVDREWIYFPGIAANMSLAFNTKDRFHSQHVFHNIIVSYTQRSEDF